MFSGSGPPSSICEASRGRLSPSHVLNLSCLFFHYIFLTNSLPSFSTSISTQIIQDNLAILKSNGYQTEFPFAVKQHIHKALYQRTKITGVKILPTINLLTWIPACKFIQTTYEKKWKYIYQKNQYFYQDTEIKGLGVFFSYLTNILHNDHVNTIFRRIVTLTRHQHLIMVWLIPSYISGR